MNYIDVLSDEELYTLCEYISGKAIKKLYQKNSEWFGTIKPGFRPSRVSDMEARALAVKNRHHTIISEFLDKTVKKWVSEVDVQFDRRKSEGMKVSQAMAVALLGSQFEDHIDLYFKLKKDSVEEDYLKEIQNNMKIYSRNKSFDTNNTFVDKSEMAQEISSLEKTIEKLESELESFKSQNTDLSQQLEAEKQRTKNLEITVQKYKDEMKDYVSRIEYDDSENVSTATTTDHDHISLCEVTEYDYKGMKYLDRLADIDSQGRVQPFYSDMSLPLTFDNRNRLYYGDGTSEPGTVAVWNWSAIPKTNDPSMDYLKRSYNSLISPIEVVLYKECDSVEKVLTLLKNGITYSVQTERVVFGAYLSKGQCTGILCKRSDLEESGGLIRIKEKVINLPQYDFSMGDAVKLNNEKYYFRRINIGIPAGIIRVKSPIDIVRTILLTRSTWSLFKEKGKTRNEWKQVRDFLEGLEKDSLIGTIAEQARCSFEEAQVMLDDFMLHAGAYIDGTTIEDKIVEAVISVNEDLKNECKAIIQDEWETENEKIIVEAQKRVEELNENIKSQKSEYAAQMEEGRKKIEEQRSQAKAELENISQEHDFLLSENEKLRSSIETNKKLASDVELNVAERIKKAQADVAEFIASMAFAIPNITMQSPDESHESKERDPDLIELQIPDMDKVTYYAGEALSSDDPDECITWKEVLGTIALELENAGVGSNYSHSLSAYLYASYKAAVPVFLIGPNGREIADAFCAGIFGKKSGILECADAYSAKTVDECYLSDDSIVTIVNPFSAPWISRIPDIISNRSKYFFIVYPFEEDIQIEPKSLYAYMLPLLTSLVVENDPIDDPQGGIIVDGFKDYAMKQVHRRQEPVLKAFKTPVIVKNKMNNILGNMHLMLNETNYDHDVLYTLLPYAFATMQMPTLMNVLNEPDNSLRISSGLMNSITGLYGEYE